MAAARRGHAVRRHRDCRVSASASPATFHNLDSTQWNDRARSMIVRHGRWQLCTDAYFRGNCHGVRAGPLRQHRQPDRQRELDPPGALTRWRSSTTSRACAASSRSPARSPSSGCRPTGTGRATSRPSTCRTTATGSFRSIPNYAEVLGERCYPQLADDSRAGRHRRLLPPRRGDARARARSRGQGREGAVDAARHPQRRGRARSRSTAGLDVVMNRCVKIEHARILGGLNWAGVNTGVISSQRPHMR